MSKVSIGIVGGSGLYKMGGVKALREVEVATPFGSPSDAVMIGELDSIPVAFLPRHGRGHRFAPHEVNYRANIWALKSLGVKWLISVTAVGSLRQEIAPGELVLVDQFLDRTRRRPSTFFEDGIVAHVPFAEPCCGVLRGALAEAAADAGIAVHERGSYVCIEGPQFSTRTESMLFRSFGIDVVGMTALPEARLAREAQIAYAPVAMATDYDCWHETEEDVSVEAVIEVMKANVEKAQRLVRGTLPKIASLPASDAWKALEFALITAPAHVSAEARERVGLFFEDAPWEA